MNEKIKRKAHVKQSFSLDFLERGTFTEYPDQNVKETISSLKTLANDMSSGFVTFKKFQTRRYQYNPDADATLYASRLLRAASILEFLLTDPDNKS